jgi:membrane protein
MLIYWAAITVGPLVLGASLSITSYAVSASRGVVGGLPGGFGFLLDSVQFLLVAAGMAAMFRYVPNTHVRWGHAWMGGLFVSAGMELAKKVLAMYLSKVPTYSVVYGAFATVPILLVWIYVAWVIVLLGAALTAYVPSLLAGVPRKRAAQGWQFQLALEVLQALDVARKQEIKGLTASQLCPALQVDALRLEPVLEALVQLDWIGQLTESISDGDEARFILLADPEQTLLEPLMDKLLLPRSEATEKLYEMGRWPATPLRKLL